MSGRFRGRGRGRGRGRRQSKLSQRVRTLEISMKHSEPGKWARPTNVIGMKPHNIDAKMYRVVRLQNTTGEASWEPSIADIMSTIEPAFENFQLVSFTIYGPTVAGMPTAAQFDSTGVVISTLKKP